MSYSFTRTRNQLMTMVLNKVIMLGSSTPSTSDSNVVYEAIDLRLKEMHRLGIFWRNVNKTPLSFTLTASTSSASASADILFPIQMMVVNGSIDSSVRIIDVKEYAGISNKTDLGVPTRVLWNGSAEFIFHPVPVSSTTAKLTYENIAEDSADATAIDMDVSMLRWMRDLIAYDVGDYFGVNEAKMDRWMKESLIAERNIRNLSVQRVDLAPVEVDNFDDKTALRDYV